MYNACMCAFWEGNIDPGCSFDCNSNLELFCSAAQVLFELQFRTAEAKGSWVSLFSSSGEPSPTTFDVPNLEPNTKYAFRCVHAWSTLQRAAHGKQVCLPKWCHCHTRKQRLVHARKQRLGPPQANMPVHVNMPTQCICCLQSICLVS